MVSKGVFTLQEQSQFLNYQNSYLYEDHLIRSSSLALLRCNFYYPPKQKEIVGMHYFTIDVKEMYF